MEKSINENIMPEIRLFPTLDRVAGFIGRVVSLGHVTEDCLTEHKRGAAEMMDAQLYEQPELPLRYLTDAEIAEKYQNQQIIERTDTAQLGNTGGRWTDMGTY